MLIIRVSLDHSIAFRIWLYPPSVLLLLMFGLPLCHADPYLAVKKLSSIIVQSLAGCFVGLEGDEGEASILPGLAVLREPDALETSADLEEFLQVLLSAAEGKTTDIDGVLLD